MVSAIIGIVASNEFLAFRERLEKKQIGEPFAHWLKNSDSALFLVGGGDCRVSIPGDTVADGLEIVLKEYPKNEEDPFAGFEIVGGVQAFLRQRYEAKFGEIFFKQYVAIHNQTKYKLKASELFEWWLEKHPAEDLGYTHLIRHALKRQNPQIHIPL